MLAAAPAQQLAPPPPAAPRAAPKDISTWLDEVKPGYGEKYASIFEDLGVDDEEDMARLLQFCTGTSKVPLDGFKALQGISGPQKFQIHRAYGPLDRLPAAHTCFNQLDLIEYESKDQLREKLLLAIHEGSEGFGFG